MTPDHHVPLLCCVFSFCDLVCFLFCFVVFLFCCVVFLLCFVQAVLHRLMQLLDQSLAVNLAVSGLISTLLSLPSRGELACRLQGPLCQAPPSKTTPSTGASAHQHTLPVLLSLVCVFVDAVVW